MDLSVNPFYWPSTEYNNDFDALYIEFDDAETKTYPKNLVNSIRAISAF